MSSGAAVSVSRGSRRPQQLRNTRFSGSKILFAVSGPVPDRPSTPMRTTPARGVTPVNAAEAASESATYIIVLRAGGGAVSAVRIAVGALPRASSRPPATISMAVALHGGEGEGAAAPPPQLGQKHMRQSRRPPARAVATGLAKKTCGGGAYEVTRRPIRPQHRLVGRGGVEWEERPHSARTLFCGELSSGTRGCRGLGHRVTQSPCGRPARCSPARRTPSSASHGWRGRRRSG